MDQLMVDLLATVLRATCMLADETPSGVSSCSLCIELWSLFTASQLASCISDKAVSIAAMVYSAITVAPHHSIVAQSGTIQ